MDREEIIKLNNLMEETYHSFTRNLSMNSSLTKKYQTPSKIQSLILTKNKTYVLDFEYLPVGRISYVNEYNNRDEEELLGMRFQISRLDGFKDLDLEYYICLLLPSRDIIENEDFTEIPMYSDERFYSEASFFENINDEIAKRYVKAINFRPLR